MGLKYPVSNTVGLKSSVLDNLVIVTCFTTVLNGAKEPCIKKGESSIRQIYLCRIGLTLSVSQRTKKAEMQDFKLPAFFYI